MYAGADGAFTIYEDDGISNDYETGMFTRIPVRWTEATRTLTIGKREGSFAGMLATRTFKAMVVTAAKAVPFSFAPPAGKSIPYVGQAVSVQLP